MKPVRFLS